MILAIYQLVKLAILNANKLQFQVLVKSYNCNMSRKDLPDMCALS